MLELLFCRIGLHETARLMESLSAYNNLKCLSLVRVSLSEGTQGQNDGSVRPLIDLV